MEMENLPHQASQVPRSYRMEQACSPPRLQHIRPKILELEERSCHINISMKDST